MWSYNCLWSVVGFARALLAFSILYTHLEYISQRHPQIRELTRGVECEAVGGHVS